ncbi:MULTISPECIES: M14 family metallocarboxypeptidase [Neobacillus]|uniref:M14 family metallocarboxypeptidase n=1 Tax=Neobacillus sedimentimangrovi TaxID=2699460 RepID=A0ABS8QLL7_9BACI|nr:M14 family metallocarboxypeptidase [Neobacillus sedimentimangrovi]MCD4840171.1 M14 family metallocarboxypeptidase [Neobacillus sedimentimangrovi]
MTKIISCFLLFMFLVIQPVHAQIVKTNKAYSFESLEKDIAKIDEKYGQIVEIQAIGTSHLGRKIWGINLGKGKKNVVLIGAHHGREWLTSLLLMKMLENYSEAYLHGERIGSLPIAILDEVSIWFIPMLNPDGVTIQQNGIEGFPPEIQKELLIMNDGYIDFKGWKANAKGVDLNRQYPAGWKKLKNDPSNPYYKFYKGKKPFEAREVIALKNFINKINPSIAVAYHTAGQEIFWNYKNGKHLKRDKAIAKKISKVTGYKLAKPDKDAIGGGFTDWFITSYHKPAMTIEISQLVGETSPPLSVFHSEWQRNQRVGLVLAKEAKKIH